MDDLGPDFDFFASSIDRSSLGRKLLPHLEKEATLEAEVKGRFGVLPNFFRLTPECAEITDNLWRFACFAYLDNPLPSLFKERLFVYLSRFCEVRYCKLGVGEYRVTGDFTRLQQVFWNLLKNSSKFTPKSGAIQVDSRREGLTWIIVEISDNGAGINEDALTRIFEPFEQAEASVQAKFGGSVLV